MYFDDSTRDEDRSWSDGVRTRVTSWGGRESPLVLLSSRPIPSTVGGLLQAAGFIFCCSLTCIRGSKSAIKLD